MFAHALRDGPHANTSEVVDAEAGVAGIVSREDTLEAGLEEIVLQSFLQLLHAHCL